MDTTKQIEAQASVVLHGKALLVPAEKRFEFLPMLFGEKLMIIGERTVYSLLSKFCATYRGGFWDFVEIPNGGYMRPSAHSSHLYKLRVPTNFFDGHVSADAVGIIVTLMALSHMSFQDQSDICADRFYALRDFVDDHPEASKIFLAIN